MDEESYTKIDKILVDAVNTIQKYSEALERQRRINRYLATTVGVLLGRILYQWWRGTNG